MEVRDYAAIAEGYARDVVAKRIPAGKYIRLACKRHLDDLKKVRRKAFPFRFDPDKACRPCRFIERLPHSKGKWAAKKELLRLEPWQIFAICATFGWLRKDNGLRRYRKARLYKPVSVLESEADTAAQSFTNEGESKRPLSPVGVTGARDGSNNLTIAWHRRSRLSGAGLFGGDPPLGEDVEAYEIDVIVASVVVRTLTSTTQSVAYSAAEQTSDGITPGNPVTGDIYQMSGSRGRGHARRFIV